MSGLSSKEEGRRKESRYSRLVRTLLSFPARKLAIQLSVALPILLRSTFEPTWMMPATPRGNMMQRRTHPTGAGIGQTDSLPPYSPEAERGVRACGLLNTSKTLVALNAGVTSRWFFDSRHIEIFNILVAMAKNGGGDFVVATMKLRDKGLLDQIGLPYINGLMDATPSAQNLEFYIPELRACFHRRSVIEIGTRLRTLAQDMTVDPDRLYADAGDVLRIFQTQGDGLPEIVRATDFLATDIPAPPEIVSGVLHQGSKLIVGGASKSYKTWALIDLAVSVATGTNWLGFETVAGRVLYVNL